MSGAAAGPVLLAAGVCSSLGGCRQAAAAVRAGLTRPSPLTDGDDPALGHPAAGIEPALDGDARLSALLESAAADLRTQAAVPPDCPLVLAAPPDADAAVVARAIGDDERELHCQLGGNAAFAAACARARELLAGGASHCLLAAVDSLCAPTALRVLGDSGALLSGEGSDGCVPGEAAVLLLLANVGAAPLRLQSAGSAARAAAPPAAQGLSWAALLAEQLGESGSFGVSVDCDGRYAHAVAWGTAQANLAARGLTLGDAHYPALAFGACGAATGALAAACRLQARERGYAAEPQQLIALMDEVRFGAVLLGN